MMPRYLLCGRLAVARDVNAHTKRLGLLVAATCVFAQRVDRLLQLCTGAIWRNETDIITRRYCRKREGYVMECQE